MLQDSPIQIDAASWRAWKQHPITQEVFRVVSLEREEWANGLLEGATLLDRTPIASTAKAVGVVQGLDALLKGIEKSLREQWDEEQEQLLKESENQA